MEQLRTKQRQTNESIKDKSTTQVKIASLKH